MEFTPPCLGLNVIGIKRMFSLYLTRQIVSITLERLKSFGILEICRCKTSLFNKRNGVFASVIFNLKIHHNTNRYALEQNADYIFQTDSDGQTLPEEFYGFWELRHQYSAVIGYRNHRKDGFSRVFVTKTLKFVLWCIFKLNITDANTPFRLLNKDVLQRHISKIPKDFNLSNVMLTICLVKYKENIPLYTISLDQGKEE